MMKCTVVFGKGEQRYAKGHNAKLQGCSRGKSPALSRQFQRFVAKIFSRFELQRHLDNHGVKVLVEATQRGLQLLTHFSIFNVLRLPDALFIEQPEVINIGKTLFFSLKFNPPAPEFTLLRRGFYVNAYR